MANPNGTVTLTYSNFAVAVIGLYPKDTTCPDLNGSFVLPPAGTLFIAPVDASPVTFGVGTSVASSGPSDPTTLPAGDYALCLFNSTAPGSYYLITDGGTVPIFTQITSSFVANGDGTITVTYANADILNSQNAYLVFLSSTATCPVAFDGQGPGYGFQTEVNMPASPAVIGVGSNSITLPSSISPTFAPLPAGVYQVCLYQPDTLGDMVLKQAQLVTLGAEPVTPSFTG